MKHIWPQCASCFPVFCPLLIPFEPVIIETIKDSGQVHCESTGVFLRRCQGNGTSSVLSTCVRVIDCHWKRSSFTLSQVWTTQQVAAHANWASLAVCQGFMKAACVWRGMEVNSTCMHCVYVCLCWTLICTSPFSCGQSVASCLTNCALSTIVPSALKPSECAK